MPDLQLADHGTDRDRFVRLMLALKASNPEAYAVMRDQMLALSGELKLDASERAALVDRFRACAPNHPKMAKLAIDLEQQLAEGAAS